MKKRRSRAIAVMVLCSMLVSAIFNMSLTPHSLLAEEQEISDTAVDVDDTQVEGSLEGGQADETPVPENPAQNEENDTQDFQESVSEADGNEDQPGDEQTSESNTEEKPSTENADDMSENGNLEIDGEESKAEGPITLISGSGMSLMSVGVEGGSSYNSLSEGLDAAKSGDTLVISGEVVVDTNYSISGKEITIQLSEGSILVNNGNSAVTLTVENSATLTLNGPGTVKGIHFQVNGGTFNLSGGVHITSEKSGSIIKFNGGAGSLTGSSVDDGENYSSTSRLLDVIGSASISRISDMTFTGGQACAYFTGPGTSIETIKNSKFVSSYRSALTLRDAHVGNIEKSQFTVTYTQDPVRNEGGTAGISMLGTCGQSSRIDSISDTTISGIVGIFVAGSSIGTIKDTNITGTMYSAILLRKTMGALKDNSDGWDYDENWTSCNNGISSSISQIIRTNVTSTGTAPENQPHGIFFFNEGHSIDLIDESTFTGAKGIYASANSKINTIRNSTITGNDRNNTELETIAFDSRATIGEISGCTCKAISDDLSRNIIGFENKGTIKQIADVNFIGDGPKYSYSWGMRNRGYIERISNNSVFTGMYGLQNVPTSGGDEFSGRIDLIDGAKFISNGDERKSYTGEFVPGGFAVQNEGHIGTINDGIFEGNSAINLEGSDANIGIINSGIFIAKKYDCIRAEDLIAKAIKLEPGLSETQKEIGDSRFYVPSGKNIFSDSLKNNILFPTYDNSETPGDKLDYFISDPEDTDVNVPGHEGTGFRFLRRQLRVVYCNTNEESDQQVCVFGNFFKPGDTVTLLTQAEAVNLNDAFKDREGFEFKGWTDENGTFYDFGQELSGQRHDLTLYARWEPTEVEPGPDPKPETVTITFDPNGGVFEGSTEPTSYIHNIGDVITIPDGPTHDYLEFSHWEGSKYYPGQKYTVTGDHTFTAMWKNPGIMRVNKVWIDNNNQDGLRPSSISIRLFADGKETGRTLTLTAGDQWTGWFTELDRYKEDGTRIQYSIQEDTVEGYTSTVEGNNWSGFTVTNHRVEDTMVIEGHKTWNDNDNEAGARPETITIRLMKNGEEADTRTISAADDWSWNFGNLPRFENGQKIDYSIHEDVVEGYTSEVRGFDVINHYGSEPTEPTTEESSNEPTQPSEPTEPTEPSEPTEPTEPTQPTQPTEPSGQPTEPSAPEQSKPSATTEPGLPQTGEENGPYIWIGSLLLLAGIGLIILRRRIRDSRN